MLLDKEKRWIEELVADTTGALVAQFTQVIKARDARIQALEEKVALLSAAVHKPAVKRRRRPKNDPEAGVRPVPRSSRWELRIGAWHRSYHDTKEAAVEARKRLLLSPAEQETDKHPALPGCATARENEERRQLPTEPPQEYGASRNAPEPPQTASEPTEVYGDAPASETTPERVYPIPASRLWRRRFWYLQTQEGLDLLTNLNGRVESLGFHDSEREVLHAIKEYLYSRNYEPDVVDAALAVELPAEVSPL